MNLKSLDEKYESDKKMLDEKFESEYEVMRNILCKELSRYVSRKYFDNLVEVGVKLEEEVDSIRRRVKCFVKLECDIEKLFINMSIYIYSYGIDVSIVVCYTNKYGKIFEFESVYDPHNEENNENLCYELYFSSFVYLAPILTKFITTDYYAETCQDIYRYSQILYNTNYLHNLPKAITFYLSSKIFPRDISKIIYKKILFFKK